MCEGCSAEFGRGMKGKSLEPFVGDRIERWRRRIAESLLVENPSADKLASAGTRCPFGTRELLNVERIGYRRTERAVENAEPQ